MKDEQYFSTNEILKKFPQLRVYHIDYLVRNKKIPCLQSGKGHPRKFPNEAIEILRKWQEKQSVS